MKILPMLQFLPTMEGNPTWAYIGEHLQVPIEKQFQLIFRQQGSLETLGKD